MDITGMGIGMWLFWIALIVVVVLVVKMLNGVPNQSATTSESPRKILEKRYVRGEIDKDEFEEMKKELEK